MLVSERGVFIIFDDGLQTRKYADGGQSLEVSMLINCPEEISIAQRRLIAQSSGESVNGFTVSCDRKDTNFNYSLLEPVSEFTGHAVEHLAARRVAQQCTRLKLEVPIKIEGLLRMNGRIIEPPAPAIVELKIVPYNPGEVIDASINLEDDFFAAMEEYENLIFSEE